jgi:hypothetical protein
MDPLGFRGKKQLIGQRGGIGIGALMGYSDERECWIYP